MVDILLEMTAIINLSRDDTKTQFFLKSFRNLSRVKMEYKLNYMFCQPPLNSWQKQ